jgi:nucleoside-diphosphate-sugar epimerase
MRPPEDASKNPLASDLDGILARAGGSLEELRGKRIFITGGTGFFGAWLLECLSWANLHMNLGVSALVLTRDPRAFRDRHPLLAENPAFAFHQGDVRNFEFPPGRFSHLIHAAATPAQATFQNEGPLEKFDLQTLGARRTLDFALRCGAEQLLYTSSGSAYGPQPEGLTHIPEDYPGAPDPLQPSQALGHGKRTAEFLCATYAAKHGFEVKMARGFCFVGPFLQMDAQYAIGNFLLDALRGGPIQIRGDGTPRRSYLYAADLMTWLWTIFIKGKSCRPYNLGSEKDFSIRELAELVRQSLGLKEPVEIADRPRPGEPISRYVPCTLRARSELGLEEYTDLPKAIVKTAEFYAQAALP